MVRKHKGPVVAEEGGATLPAEHIREELLQCKLCTCPFTPLTTSTAGSQLGDTGCGEVLRIPKVLLCSHTYCHLCIGKELSQAKRKLSKPKFACPLCKKDTPLPKSGVEGLQNNCTVLGLLDILQGHCPLASSGEGTPASTQVPCTGVSAPAHTAQHTSAKGKKMASKSRFFKGFKSRSKKGADSKGEDEVLSEVTPNEATPSGETSGQAEARHEEKRREAEAAPAEGPVEYSGRHLYPTLRTVRFEEPQGENEENQPPPYSRYDSKAAEAAASPPPNFNALYPNLDTSPRQLGPFPDGRPVGPLDLQYTQPGYEANLDRLCPNGVPLPGMARHMGSSQAQSMRVTSPGRRTLERRLGGSMRNFPSTPDLSCNNELDGSVRCTVDNGMSDHHHMDLAQPRAAPVAVAGQAAPSGTQGQRPPHFVININKPQATRAQATGQNMAQKQVVFLNQGVHSSQVPSRPPGNQVHVNTPQVHLNPPPPPPQVSSMSQPQPPMHQLSNNTSQIQVNQAASFTQSMVHINQVTSSMSSDLHRAPVHSSQPQAPPTIQVTASNPQQPAPQQVSVTQNVTPNRKITLNDPSNADSGEEYAHSPLKLLKKFGSYGDRSLQPGLFQLPTRISTSDNGDILVVDSNFMALQLFNSMGDQLFQMKVVGLQCATVMMGNRIAVGTHRGLEIYSRSGRSLQEFQIGAVVTVTAYGSGVLVVQNKSIVGYMGVELQETQHIRKRTKGGGLMKSSAGFQRLTDVQVNGNKELVVLDAGAGEIYVLSEDGHTKMTINPSNLPCGRFLNPSSLAVDVHSNMYVCDTGNRRVLKFGAEGKYARSLVNFTLGATSMSPSVDNTLTAYGVAVNSKAGDLLLTCSADRMAQVRVYKL